VKLRACGTDEPADQAGWPVPLPDLGETVRDGNPLTRWTRDHVAIPKSIPRGTGLVLKGLHLLGQPSQLRLADRAGVMRDQSTQALRRALLAEKSGTVQRVKASPSQIRGVTDVVQSSCSNQQVTILTEHRRYPPSLIGD